MYGMPPLERRDTPADDGLERWNASGKIEAEVAVPTLKTGGESMNTLKRVGEFDARDGSGQRHRIVVYREMIDASDLSGSAGDFFFKTDSGNAVNRLERGKYEIVHSGTEVHSTNPNASWESA